MMNVMQLRARKLRVLIVEDGITMRMFYRDVLERAGFEVEEAVNGLEGVERAMTGSFDLLVVDINMPKMDGLQLLAAMKNSHEWRDVPVVMITTEGGETKVGEAVRLGAAGYVRKPFTADQIMEKLVGILEPAMQL